MRYGYCIREIKMRIAIAKEAFNRKILLLTCKLNTELRKKLVRSYIWSIALYGSETWALLILERKYFESFEMWCWKRMDKMKWPVLERIGEKRTLLNNILRRKLNWIGHILRRNYLLYWCHRRTDDGMNGVGRTQLLDDLRNRRRYWELNEEAANRNSWKWQFINLT